MEGRFAQKTPMKRRKQLRTNKTVEKVKKKLRPPVIYKDVEELLRLMKRTRPVLKDRDPSACRVCAGSVDHIGRECPRLDRIPPGAVLAPQYDYVCNGCGKIGENCCSKGAYAVRRRCACPCDDHWYWERRCSKDWQRPDIIAEIPSVEELEEKVMKKKNKNKEEDEVMIDVGKDNKKEAEVMVEDDKNSITEQCHYARSQHQMNHRRRECIVVLLCLTFCNQCQKQLA